MAVMTRVRKILGSLKRTSGAQHAAGERAAVHPLPRLPPCSVVAPTEMARPLRTEEEIAKDEEDKKVLLNNVRSLLNKLTPSNEGELFVEFSAFNMSQSTWVDDVIDLIFDKAIGDDQYHDLYVRLIKFQVQTDADTMQKSPFYDAFLQRIKDEKIAILRSELCHVQPKIEHFDGDTNAYNERLEEVAQYKRSKFGFIMFLASFSVKLSQPIWVNYCLHNLLQSVTYKPANLGGYKADDEEVQCAVRLIERIGCTIEYENAKAKIAGEEQEYKLNEALELLVEAVVSKIVSHRTKFLIFELMDLHASMWTKSERVADGTCIAV